MLAERYLKDVWPRVTSGLKEHGIACELNLVFAPAVPSTHFAKKALCATVKCGTESGLIVRTTVKQLFGCSSHSEMQCCIGYAKEV